MGSAWAPGWDAACGPGIAGAGKDVCWGGEGHWKGLARDPVLTP